MMIFSSVFTELFFLLIIMTGVLTTITDLRHQKIRNNHLILIALAAVVLTVMKGLSDRALPMLQLSSGACAIIIAWIFYKNDLWRGGDAKLFIIFSFLMPATGYESRVFLPSIALFVNAFMIALIFLSLLFLKDLFNDPKIVTENILKNLDLKRIINMILMTLCISWIFFPLFHLRGLSKYGVLSFLSVYVVIFLLRKLLTRLIYNKVFAVTAFVCGLFFRYKFLPSFFLWKNFLLYLCTVIIYSALSIIMLRGTKYINQSHERVPFAPFLCLGCLASYTPFLWWVMFLRHWGK